MDIFIKFCYWNILIYLLSTLKQIIHFYYFDLIFIEIFKVINTI